MGKTLETFQGANRELAVIFTTEKRGNVLTIKKSNLTLAQVNSYAQELLVGAYLDSFIVTSVSILLRFINPSLKEGSNLYVNGYFTCSAKVVRRGATRSSREESDFFIERSRFIGEMFFCIGKGIENVHVEGDGTLVLVTGEASVELQVHPEDFEGDDSVWSVSVDSEESYRPVVNSVSCMADDSVHFVAELLGRSHAGSSSQA